MIDLPKGFDIEIESVKKMQKDGGTIMTDELIERYRTQLSDDIKLLGRRVKIDVIISCVAFAISASVFALGVYFMVIK